MGKYLYTPRNPSKYAGDPRRISARSKLELIYMQALDTSTLVNKWVSEPKTLNINYVSPIDRKVHSYWPDFLIQYRDGSIDLVEIKPLKEAVLEHAGSTYDKLELVKNAAKWQAADRFAKSIGARFRIITEKQLYRHRSTKQTKRTKGTKPARKTGGTR